MFPELGFQCLAAMRPHLFSLDVVLDLGYFDLYNFDPLILDQRDGGGLTVLDGLEGQISQRDVPLTVIMLPLSGGEMRGSFTWPENPESFVSISISL